jgi:hypothetical protein
MSDVTFLTGMGYLARELARAGSRNLVLMPHGCCQVRFSAPLDTARYRPEFAAVFIGSRLPSRNPLSHFFWMGRKRDEFVAALTRRYGRRFGLFGRGWTGNPSWLGPVEYGDQHQTYRRGALALGGVPNAYYDYYMSDRPFIAAASGVPLVDLGLPGVARVLQPERDWWLARDLAAIAQLCDRLIALPDAKRLELGQEARRHVLAVHTQYHRCREMVQTVERIRVARLHGKRASRPELGFLSSQTSFGRNAPPDIINWEG